MTLSQYADSVALRYRNEALLWAPDGCWYQYTDEGGKLQICKLGFADSYAGLCAYAEEHGLPVFRFPNTFTSFAKRPAARAARAQTAGTSGHPLRQGASVRGQAVEASA